MRMSLPTPAELEAVRKKIEDLEREAQEAKQLGKETLYLTLREELVPLRQKEERLDKGESSSAGNCMSRHAACMRPPLTSEITSHDTSAACMRNQRARHAAARRACSWPSAGAG